MKLYRAKKWVSIYYLGALLSLSAQAAEIEVSHWSTMQAAARRDGAVPVVVHLYATTLAQLRSDLDGAKRNAAVVRERLLTELGVDVWPVGRWDSGVGQVGLYVTPRGLDKLRASSTAIKVYPDRRWIEASPLLGLDGSLIEIERRLTETGSAEILLTVNADGMAASVQADAVRFTAPPGRVQTALTALADLIQSADDSEIVDRLSLVGALRSGRPDQRIDGPTVILKASRQGIVRLATSNTTRTIQPVSFVDARPRYFDEGAEALLRRDGSVYLRLILRNPHYGGRLSSATLAAQTESTERALLEILQGFGVSSVTQSFARFGSVVAKFNSEQFNALRRSEDRRILAVGTNRILGMPALASSGPTINIQSAWNVGYRGAGQNIVVMDTGVDASHPFLAGRVTFEACFGSNAVRGSVTYVSVCQPQNSIGDGPLGLAGSAAPPYGGGCASVDPDLCSHGTHVAGIASGRAGPNVEAGLQGMAPDSSIIAVQVASFDVEKVRSPIILIDDYLKALEAVVSSTVPFTPASNPYTINMSIAGSQASSSCTAGDMTDVVIAVQQLFEAGVPVVAATGNNFSSSAITEPSCVPRVIKVTSTRNDGIGQSRAPSANLANPANFPGDAFWFAPGGFAPGGIRSSAVGASPFDTIEGTSMAAPHISGLYALAKSVNPTWDVNSITNYFISYAAAPVLGADNPYGIQRIRLPNY